MPFASSSLQSDSDVGEAGTKLSIGGRSDNPMYTAQRDALEASRQEEIAARQRAIHDGMLQHEEERARMQRVNEALLQKRRHQREQSQHYACALVAIVAALFLVRLANK